MANQKGLAWFGEAFAVGMSWTWIWFQYSEPYEEAHCPTASLQFHMFFQNNCESAMEKSHDTTFSDLKRLWEGTMNLRKKHGLNDQKIVTSKRAHFRWPCRWTIYCNFQDRLQRWGRLNPVTGYCSIGEITPLFLGWNNPILGVVTIYFITLCIYN